ncbi:MAG: hypothetical protein V1702_04795 [Candidatus Woesearchaeota archaeon]
MKKVNYLGDVAADKVFWVNNGGILKNLEEMSVALKEINPEQFAYHVNKEKNDFSSWVRDVICDKTLAVALMKAKTKAAALKAVKARIAKLRK